MAKFFKNLLVLLISLSIALAIFELGVRYIFNDRDLGNQYKFYQFDPKLGWSNTPGETGTYSRSEFSYTVTNNADGMRDASIATKQPGEIRVGVLGDSHTWGVGAAFGERFTEVMEQNTPTMNVLNYGVSGFGTVQQHLQLEAVLAKDPDIVVVAFCLSNDVLDNVKPFRYGYHKPVARLSKNGKAEIEGYPLYQSQRFGSSLSDALSNLASIDLVRKFLRHQAEKNWMARNSPERSFAITRKDLYARDASLSKELLKERAEAMKITTSLLRSMQSKVDKTIGPGRFLVLLVPTKSELGLKDIGGNNGDPNKVANMLVSGLQGSSIPIIDGRTVIEPEDFWENDGHWRPTGHSKIGTLLGENVLSHSR